MEQKGGKYSEEYRLVHLDKRCTILRNFSFLLNQLVNLRHLLNLEDGGTLSRR
jgi:hypothetical protein